MKIDYEILLIKYMANVIQCEGENYLNKSGESSTPFESCIDFNSQESKELVRISKLSFLMVDH